MIAKALEEIEEYCKNKKKWVESLYREAKIVEDLAEQFSDVISTDVYYAPDIGWHDATILGARLRMNVNEFRETLPILEVLHDKGYTEMESEDYPILNRRIYICKCPAAHTITLISFLNDDAICHKVQVGVEPVYKFVC